MNQLLSELEEVLVAVRQTKPLVLCLTNFVTMDLMANGLYALGASPLMSHSIDEMEDLVSLSSALCLNLGTLDQAFCERAVHAAKLAKSQSKPVILDPVGAGASRLRTEAAKSLLPYATILRANPSETLALTADLYETKGVEAIHSTSEAATKAKLFAKRSQKVIVITGPVDWISDGIGEQTLPFGSELMPLITGMGCTLSAVIAAFAANLPSYKAAYLATAYFGLCGQQSHFKTKQPGSFRLEFINTLFQPDWQLFNEFVNLKGINA